MYQAWQKALFILSIYGINNNNRDDKMKIGFVVALSMVSVLLVGCATPTTKSPQGSAAEIEREARLQKELLLNRYIAESKDVHDVAFPVLEKNAALCEDTAYSLGMNLWNKYTVPEGYQTTAEINHGVGDVMQILFTYDNGPAQLFGLERGDHIVAVNGIEVKKGKQAKANIDELLDTDAPQVDFIISRDGEEMQKIVQRSKVCDFGIVYDPNDMAVNAFADGENIIITRGMKRFVENDNELALVVAHEIGHNAMGHIDKKKLNMAGADAGGLVLDVLAAAAGVNTCGAFTDMAMQAGAGAYSVEFEQEADYVGMYFMERAGYDTKNVANFWRRMAAENSGAGIDQRSTHPATAERFVAIEKTYAEIQQKIAAGRVLEPEIDLEKEARREKQKSRGFN